MLGPKSLFYKKYHRKYISNLTEIKTLLPANGGFGLKSLKAGRIPRYQLVALLKYLRRNIKKTDRFWFDIFPDVMETKKGLGARMGKGKGAVDDYVALFKEGRLILEFGGFHLPPSKIRRIARACALKLPLPLKLIRRYL